MSRKLRTKKGSINGNFVAHPCALRESPAWRALPDNARRVLDRLELEHMRHGGAENGHLKCTYSDFVLAGLRRASVSLAIRQCVALGFLKITKRGGRSISDVRSPSQYFLTYLPGWKRSLQPTDDWKLITSDVEARLLLERAAAERDTHSQRTQPKPEKAGRASAPGAGRENGTVRH